MPALRTRARDTESARRLPEATVRELHASGLFRILQPARVGGGQLPLQALVDVSAELARGCASTGWVHANLAMRHWMLAMFPPDAQDAVWDDSRDALIAASLIFTAGRARRGPGGFVLDGRWPFASGLALAGWSMVAANVTGDAGEPGDARLFLLPASAYRIVDQWHVAGLAGTGSADLVAEQAFVPEALSLPVAQLKGGPTPGHALNPAPLYRLPLFTAFPFTLAGVALGNAQGLLDAYLGLTAPRVGRYGGAKLAELQSTQLLIAQASAQIDAAVRTVRDGCTELAHDATRGVVPALSAKARLRRDGAYAAGLCTDAVTRVFNAAGAAALLLDSPLQRAFRDAHAIQSHITFSFDIVGTQYGRAALGLDVGNPFL